MKEGRLGYNCENGRYMVYLALLGTRYWIGPCFSKKVELLVKE